MTELTEDEFYDNGNIAKNIAALLGISPSKIKMMNVVRYVIETTLMILLQIILGKLLNNDADDVKPQVYTILSIVAMHEIQTML